MKILITNLISFSVLFYCCTALSLPNPASVNCTKQGNKLALIKNTGICIFADNTYCEEWALLRGTCKQGQNAFPGGEFNKQKMNTYCIKKTGTPTVVSVVLCNTSRITKVQ